MRAMTNLPVREIVSAVSRRELSAESLVRAYVERIETMEREECHAAS
jgi:Asp-tRNA(Asn)/Glu-tRNA(Gln) amidotransferase A subunit family amidase